MSRFVLAVVALAIAAPAYSAAAAPPEAGKSYPYPARAPVVVTLNGFDKARERLAKLGTAALPDEGPKLIKRLDGVIDKVMEGRKLSAIRKDARLFVVLNDLGTLFDEGVTPISVVLPITAYKDFRESFLKRDELKSLDHGADGVDAIKTAAFGEEIPLYLVDLKEHVAITPDKATAEVYAGKFTRASTEQMSPEMAEAYLKSDLAVFVNMDAVNDQFGDKIKGFKGLIDFGLQQAAQQGTLPGFTQKQMDSLKVFMKGGFQGIEDCRGVLATAEFRPDGLALRAQARFAEESVSAKFLAGEKPAPIAEIAKLPAGLGTYGGMRFGRTISELLHDIGQNLSTTADDVQGTKLIEGHTKDLNAAGHQGDVSGTTTPGVSITISSYSDPAKAVRALTKTYKAIAAGGRVNSVMLKAAPRVQEEVETHGDFKFSSVFLQFDFDGTVAEMPDQVKEAALQSLKRTLNPQTTMWIGTDGKVVISLSAKDWKSAKELLDQYRDGKQTIGANESYKQTRAQLPAEANFLLIAETGSAINTILESMRSTGDAIPGFPRIPVLKPVKGDPTYIGIAVVLKGESASVTAFFPTAAIGVAGKVLQPLFKNVE